MTTNINPDPLFTAAFPSGVPNNTQVEGATSLARFKYTSGAWALQTTPKSGIYIEIDDSGVVPASPSGGDKITATAYGSNEMTYNGRTKKWICGV